MGQPTSERDMSLVLYLTEVVSPTGAPPSLKIALRNEGATAVPLVRFSTAPCFAHAYLDLSLTDPAGKVHRGPECAASSPPGKKGSLAANADASFLLTLAEAFPTAKWSKGRYAFTASWEPKRVREQFGAGAAPEVNSTTGGGDDFVLADVVAKVRVERGSEVRLPDGARLVFKAHGHKHQMVGGPRSPLIIHGSFAAPGKKALSDFETRVHPGESRSFVVGDGFVFDLVDHDYDGWMDLQYYGRIDPRPRGLR